MRIIVILAVGVFFLSAGTLLVGKNEAAASLSEARINLALRSIGHQLLLQAGDSTSRILPVKKKDAATYYLEFQSPFSFVPDTLVKVVHQHMKSANLPLHYMVNVLNCSNINLVVYGYEFVEKKTDRIACLGRTQPTGCYVIQVVFPELADTKASSNAYVWLTALSAMVLVAFVGGSWRKREKKKTQALPPDVTTTINTVNEEPFIALGKYAFYDTHRRLKSENESIELSDKESRLLKIFALHPNQTVDRDRLLKEVWEDDGVFVGRSLDVFVSKLRKKLQNDRSLRIANVHGKGYKLETGIEEAA